MRCGAASDAPLPAPAPAHHLRAPFARCVFGCWNTKLLIVNIDLYIVFIFSARTVVDHSGQAFGREAEQPAGPGQQHDRGLGGERGEIMLLCIISILNTSHVANVSFRNR